MRDKMAELEKVSDMGHKDLFNGYERISFMITGQIVCTF